MICDHPILAKILQLCLELTRDGKEIVFAWVPSHMGIKGNSAADSAGEDAFSGNMSDELILIPFSFLKVCLNKYLRALAAGAGQVPPQQAV